MPDRLIREIMEDQHLVVANADITVSAVAQLMQQHRIGAVLIMEGPIIFSISGPAT